MDERVVSPTDACASSAAEARAALEKILAGTTFNGARRSAALLRYLVTETLEGRAAQIKEYALGAEVLGRGAAFDPRSDPIARVEASRLRGRLEHYYATEGADDALVITLPKGGYVPKVERRASPRHTAEEAASVGRVGEERAPMRRLLLGAGGALALAALGFALGRLMAPTSVPTPTPTPLRLEMALGFEGRLASEVGANLALSPDGRTLVFVALLADGSTRLYARSLDALEARELPGTIGARGPFFSPDGRWVAFWAQGRIEKTLIEGGSSPVTIAPATDLLGGSWNRRGDIVASLSREPVLWRIPEQGGAPEPLVDVTGKGGHPRWPQWLPGNRAVLFTSIRGDSEASIDVVSLLDGSVKTLVRGGTYGRYLASGHLVYVDRGSLFAVPFDLGRLEIRGTPTPVLDSVAYSRGFGYAELAVADDGALVYSPSSDEGKVTRMAWLDEGGGVTPALAEPGRYLWPRLSPDGARLAVGVLEGSDYDIWLYDLRRGTRTRLTKAEGDEGAPLWTLDGTAIIYNTASGELRWQPSDGSGSAAPLLSPPISVPWSFSPDGRRLAFHRLSSETGFDLWTVPVERRSDGFHAGTPALFYGSRVFDTYPTFSPDGRWIAYASNESGVWEVYVRAFPDDGRAVRVSQNGGRIPAWSKRGGELLYETFDHRLMAVGYRQIDGRFAPGVPRFWSNVQLADTGVLANFDLAPDGRVIAMLPSGPAGEARGDTVTLISNVFALLSSH